MIPRVRKLLSAAALKATKKNHALGGDLGCFNEAINNNGARTPAAMPNYRLVLQPGVLSVLINETLCAILANSDNRQPITPHSSIFRFAGVAPPRRLRISRRSGKIGVSSGNLCAPVRRAQRELDRCVIDRMFANRPPGVPRSVSQ